MKTYFEWRSVLAAAYLGGARRGWSATRMVDHLVATEPYTSGRLRRERGDTLCGGVSGERMADVGSSNAERCPKCNEMARRHGEGQ